MKTKLIVTISALMALTACSSVRENLGLERNTPDEYAVTPSQVALEMPPDFYKLPTPQPGAPRPQEVPHHHQAHELLTGQAHSRSSHQGKTTGTQAFLEEAGVVMGQDQVRYELDQEAEIKKRTGGTVVQQLGFKDRKPGEVLKPTEEQERLQQAGIPTSKYVEDKDEN